MTKNEYIECLKEMITHVITDGLETNLNVKIENTDEYIKKTMTLRWLDDYQADVDDTTLGEINYFFEYDLSEIHIVSANGFVFIDAY